MMDAASNNYFPSHYLKAPNLMPRKPVSMAYGPDNDQFNRQGFVAPSMSPSVNQLPATDVMPTFQFDQPSASTVYLTQVPQPVYSTQAFQSFNKMTTQNPNTVEVPVEGLPPNIVNPASNVLTKPYQPDGVAAESKNLVSKPDSAKAKTVDKPDTAETTEGTEGDKVTKKETKPAVKSEPDEALDDTEALDETETTKDTDKTTSKKKAVDDKDDANKPLYEKNAKQIGNLIEGALITMAHKDPDIKAQLKEFSTSKLDDNLITFQQKYKNKWIYRTTINSLLDGSKLLKVMPKSAQKVFKAFLEEMKQDDPLTTSDFLERSDG